MECPACQSPNMDGARFCMKCSAPLPAPPVAADPLIGTVIGGRYRVTGILGEGGMGRVYSGDQQMGTSVRKVAIKTLLAEYARDPETTARFMREVGTVSELEHPNTIKVYDFGQTPSGELYIAMELLTGVSLEKELENVGKISAERADRILGQICGSLAEAHEKGIVHRDLKPANIQLLTRAGEDDYVKVLDFGIAKKEESKQDQKLTRQGTILGTPPYMSPEQFKGMSLDPRSDIYSLGVMAFEMLTGRLPFEADTAWQWATQHMTAQPFPFESIPDAAEVPAKMRSAVMHALAKERDDRPSTVREFYEEITLGTVRMSILATAPRTSSAAELMTQHRPGGTQVGEPVFIPHASAPAGRTVIDPGGYSAPPAMGGAPTTGAQVYAPPPPATMTEKKKSGAPIVIIGGLLLAAGVAGTIFFLKRPPKEEEFHAIEIPTATSAAVGAPDATGKEPDTAPTASATAAASSDLPTVGDAPTELAGAEPSSSAAVEPTAAPTTTKANTNTGAATKPVEAAPTAAEALACSSARQSGLGGNTQLAVSQLSGCKGPGRAAAISAINSGALTAVNQRKCGAKAQAMAAKSVGANSAYNALPASCK